MVIPTPQSLRRQNRRSDRLLAGAERVITAMRAGNALHLQFLDGKPHWFLTDGRHVDVAVAAVVITHQQVVDVGDALPIPGDAHRLSDWPTSK